MYRLIRYSFVLGWIIISLFLGISCQKTNQKNHLYNTENVIIVVIDGVRYSELWGGSSNSNLPCVFHEMATEGVVYTNFYNDGPTYTTSGHVSITTGIYQEIDKTGSELPQNPSIFQYWRFSNEDKQDAWIVTGKSKLSILGNCKDSGLNSNYLPRLNCGLVSGGTRSDSATMDTALNILKSQHPKLALISLNQPDILAHQNNWKGYIESIRDADNYIFQLWNFIKSDPVYSGTTALFVTNDHGRHLDSISNGFVSHGDGCEGCRHIFLFAIGPDFERGKTINIHRGLVDIPFTIATLMNFEMIYSEGNLMEELIAPTPALELAENTITID